MRSPELLESARLLRQARRVVVFTGAGVSAESDIPTFRDAGGFWTEFPPEQFANWSSLLKIAALEPRRLARFLLAVVEPIAQARPNAAHRAIAKLEEYARVTTVTQNIDGLHQDAGSTPVYEIHGTLLETVDARSGRFERLVTRAELQDIVERVRKAADGAWSGSRLAAAIQPIFGLGKRGLHRPNLVLFGDALNEPAWTQSLAAVRECDVVLSIGTSGSRPSGRNAADRSGIRGRHDHFDRSSRVRWPHLSARFGRERAPRSAESD